MSEILQTALVDMIGKTGAQNLQIGYLDEIKPVVWVAMATYGEHHRTGSGLSLESALWDLTEEVVDGGECQHCRKPTVILRPGEINDHPISLAFSESTCVYSYRDAAIKPGCQP